MPVSPSNPQLAPNPRFFASPAFYSRFLLLVAGLGGLLYGIDIGIISAALLYLGKTVDLTLAQTSAIVAAVLGGSMLSSLLAGVTADLLGRKKMMIVSGFLFVSSVILIVLSHGFVLLFLGRLLQGISGGVIAVVVPLYLAETLPADSRGRGSAIFQFMLTFGIVTASAIGWYFIRHAELAIAAAHGNPALILEAQNHAWRSMFLAVIYPGILFFAGSFVLSETPRWLFRKGREQAAFDSLLRFSTPEQAHAELALMKSFSNSFRSSSQDDQNTRTTTHADSLLRRKYVLPFLLACTILACNQATGINSVLGYLALILKQAGMSASHATQGDFAVKLLNCVMSLIAVALIDRKGRKFLLTLGTAGIVLALSLTALLFHHQESHLIDVQSRLQPYIAENRLTLPSTLLSSWNPIEPSTLTVIYSYEDGEKIATLSSSTTASPALSNSKPDTLTLAPDTPNPQHPLTITRAFLAPQPTPQAGWLITLCLALFVASFSIGPGVVVWLALSELMPTRIRSIGMGIALLLNQGVSTLIAGVFLPTVAHHGYSTMFAAWAAITVLYFLVAAFVLPETKGKTLEEIEQSF